MVEAEGACALQQYHFVVQRLEHLASFKLLHAGEEEFFGNRDMVSLLLDAGTYADELFHTTLDGELRHLAVEHFRLVAALVYVAEYQCALAPFVVGSAVHKVECDV